MLAPLNSTMIAIAVPDVVDDLNTTLATAGWLVTGYLIAMAALQPVAGKIGDRVGHRRLFMGGVALFGVASIIASFSTSMPMLVTFRVLQGVTGAVMMPSGTALVRHSVQGTRRATGFGLLGAGASVTTVLGAPLAGLLVEVAGWRSIFAVNVLLVVPALVLGWRYLPITRPPSEKSPFDTVGSTALIIILVGMAVLLMPAGTEMDLLLIVTAATALAVLTVAFVWQQLRHPDPVVQLRVFKQRPFLGASLGIGFSNMSTYTLFLIVPLLLAARGDSSSLKAGGMLTAMFVASIFVAPLGGRLADSWGRRLPTTLGLAIGAIGAVLIAVAGFGVSTPIMLIGLSLSGFRGRTVRRRAPGVSCGVGEA